MTPTTTDNVPCLSREEVERQAGEVLHRHGLEVVPTDLIDLADRLGLAVYNAKFADENTVGLIAKRGDEITVLVNAKAPPFRKQFTLAHELGHYFLHLPEDGEFVDGEANLFRGVLEDQREAVPDRRREIQANLFAAALLMPEGAVRREWQRLGSPEAMARRFNVSEAAMGMRLGQLALG